MTRLLRVFALALTCLPFLGARAPAAEEGVYELRIYTCHPGKLDALNERFRQHTMRIFERHGMENVAYWVPTDEPAASNQLIYLLRHRSREAAQASWQAFRNDPEWKQVAQQSKEKDGEILAKPPESVYLTATDYSPALPRLDAARLYELRIYKAAEGKLDALHARFREHTVGIFARHGLTSVGYWKPMDEPGSTNLMYYVLETPDRDAAKASWQAFSADPAWQAARDASEKDGRLLAERPTSVYMKLTDYSPASK